MQKNLQDNLDYNESGDPSKLDEKELQKTLDGLDPKHIKKGLKNHWEEINKIDGLEESVKKLLHTHHNMPEKSNLSPSAVDALTAIYAKMTGKLESALDGKKLRNKHIDNEQFDEQEFKKELYKDKVNKLLNTNDGVSFENWVKSVDAETNETEEQLGTVEFSYKETSYHIEIKADGTFKNQEKGLKITDHKGENPLFARISREGDFIVEDAEANQEWKETLEKEQRASKIATAFGELDFIKNNEAILTEYSLDKSLPPQEQTINMVNLDNEETINKLLALETKDEDILTIKAVYQQREAIKKELATQQEKIDEYKGKIEDWFEERQQAKDDDEKYEDMTQEDFAVWNENIKNKQLAALKSGNKKDKNEGLELGDNADDFPFGLGKNLEELEGFLEKREKQANALIKEHQEKLFEEIGTTIKVDLEGKLVDAEKGPLELELSDSLEDYFGEFDPSDELTINNYLEIPIGKEGKAYITLDDNGQWKLYETQNGKVVSISIENSEPVEVNVENSEDVHSDLVAKIKKSIKETNEQYDKDSERRYLPGGPLFVDGNEERILPYPFPSDELPLNPGYIDSNPTNKTNEKQKETTQNDETTEELSTTYTVKKGDSLSLIAKNYNGVTWEEIYEANKNVIGNDPNKIFPGQELVIPGVDGNVEEESNEKNNPVESDDDANNGFANNNADLDVGWGSKPNKSTVPESQETLRLDSITFTGDGHVKTLNEDIATKLDTILEKDVIGYRRYKDYFSKRGYETIPKMVDNEKNSIYMVSKDKYDDALGLPAPSEELPYITIEPNDSTTIDIQKLTISLEGKVEKFKKFFNQQKLEEINNGGAFGNGKDLSLEAALRQQSGNDKAKEKARDFISKYCYYHTGSAIEARNNNELELNLTNLQINDDFTNASFYIDVRGPQITRKAKKLNLNIADMQTDSGYFSLKNFYKELGRALIEEFSEDDQEDSSNDNNNGQFAGI